MKNEELLKTNEIVMQQEQLLRFNSFHNEEALALGNYFIKRAIEENHVIAVAIRELNGAILFQSLMEGTNLKNQNWMQRKFNTVSLMGKSSFGVWLTSCITGENPESQGLEPSEYAFCGGGMPIRLKSGETVAVLTISNLPHELDHHFMVQIVAEWLKIEIPVIDLTLDYHL